MKILFATNNPSKLELYKNMFRNTDYEIVCLKDLDIIHDVIEDGNNPTENALKKAREYQSISNIITISEDSGLYLEGLEDKKQPGTHVRRDENGNDLTDDQILEKYVKIAKENGGQIKGKWLKSIAIVDNNKVEYVYEYDVEKIFTDRISERRHKGFPLDSISITPEYNKYTIDLTDEENEMLLKKNREKMYNYVINVLKNITSIN